MAQAEVAHAFLGRGQYSAPVERPTLLGVHLGGQEQAFGYSPQLCQRGTEAILGEAVAVRGVDEVERPREGTPGGGDGLRFGHRWPVDGDAPDLARADAKPRHWQPGRAQRARCQHVDANGATSPGSSHSFHQWC